MKDMKDMVDRNEYIEFMLSACEEEYQKYYMYLEIKNFLCTKYNNTDSISQDDMKDDLYNVLTSFKYKSFLSVEKLKELRFNKKEYEEYLLEGIIDEVVLTIAKKIIDTHLIPRHKYWTIQKFNAEIRRIKFIDKIKLSKNDERYLYNINIKEFKQLAIDTLNTDEFSKFIINSDLFNILNKTYNETSELEFYDAIEFLNVYEKETISAIKSTFNTIDDYKRKLISDDIESLKDQHRLGEIKTFEDNNPFIYNKDNSLKQNLLTETIRLCKIELLESGDDTISLEDVETYLTEHRTSYVIDTDCSTNDPENVEFDIELVSFESIENSLYGFNKLEGIELYGFSVGGEWEWQVFCVCYELDGKFNYYTPRNGNLYNDLYDTAFGNTTEYFSDHYSYLEKYRYLFNESELDENNPTQYMFSIDNAWARLKGFDAFNYSSNKEDKLYSDHINKNGKYNFDLIKQDIIEHWKTQNIL